MNFNLTPKEAVQQQRELRERVRIEPLRETPRIVAGSDISYNIGSDVCHAGFVLFDFASQEVIGRYSITTKMTFPYVPGLLSYREIPALWEVWQTLPERPDLLFMDGQGILHPRRLGVACHFGILADVPAIGVGKSVLLGKFDPPAPERGSISYMRDGEAIIGAAVRTKNRVKPVYVSPGHRINLEQSIEYVLRFDSGYRIPKPTRQADLFVNAVRRG